MAKISNIFNISDLYTVGWLIVNVITSVQPNAVSGRLMILLTVWSFYYFIRILFQQNNPKAVKVLNVLVIMFSIYGLLHIMFGRPMYVYSTEIYVPTNSYLKGIYSSFLPIYAYYYFALFGKMSKKKIMVWSIAFVVVAIIQYVNIYMNIAMTMFRQEEFTNNAGYIILSLFPLLAFWNKKKVVQFALAIFFTILIVLSAKRGAILICILSLVFLSFRTFKGTSVTKKRSLFILVIISFAIICHFVANQLSESDYLMMRLENTLEGDANGRDDIFSIFYNYYMNNYNIIQKLFGGGAENTICISTNYAHNDWLEILINNGLLGFMIYLYYWIVLYVTCKRSIDNEELYLLLGLYLIIYFLMTFFSMSYSSIQIYSCVCFGYALYLLKNRRRFIGICC